MPLQKVQFAPGVDKEGTEYTADSGWFDSDKIRFRKGRPEKIGGWSKLNTTAFLGMCRSLFAWATFERAKYIGAGTSLKFYIIEGVSPNDITPLRVTTSAGDVTFAATNGSSTLTVTDTGHGAVKNDFVTFSDAATLGGNITAAVLNQEYQVVSVSSANAFTITAKDTSGSTVTANSSDSGNGGSSTVGAYQINTGLSDYVSATGWGANPWGDNTWGSGAALSVAGQLRLYSQDNFGEDLVFNVRNGGIYYWDQSGGLNSRGVDITSLGGASNCPTIAAQVLVSDNDQHVIAFGANTLGSAAQDALLVRWSDQESITDWTPTATNTAGGVRINSGSEIVGAIQTRQEILIWTDVSVHSMRFIGAPFIFQFTTISSDVSMISPKAAVNARGNVYFMDQTGFYVYNGAVQQIPCSVQEYVLTNIDMSQSFKVFAAENNAFSEIIWFYPKTGSGGEISDYVSFNYNENLWAVGTLARGAWLDSGVLSGPIASSVITSTDDNYVYNHEDGHDDDGSAMTAYIESGDLEIGDGNNFMMIDRVLPDFSFSGNSAEITMTIKGSNYPLETPSSLATATITESTTQANIRARARHTVLRIESSSAGYGWRLGGFRFGMRQDGRR
ncbi:MAG: hypothetical protein CMF29_04085 [Kiritimatiellaceae bacterium]|nr:hypothetical protein [Kiritimatiellaceae bacterium]